MLPYRNKTYPVKKSASVNTREMALRRQQHRETIEAERKRLEELTCSMEENEDHHDNYENHEHEQLELFNSLNNM